MLHQIHKSILIITLLALFAGFTQADQTRLPQDEIFYQFMPICWRDSDNDTYRFGDFNGMTDSLDYLQALGVTAVWMNPIFPSPAYHGYQHGAGDQLNTRFGTEAQFLNFVEQAHARDIKVFVDFVVYGISHDSTWFDDAVGNPFSPYDTWLSFTNWGNTSYLGSTYNTWNGDNVGFIHWNLDDPNATAMITGWCQKWLDPNQDGDPSDGIDGYRLDHVWEQYPTGPNGWGYNIDWWEAWNANLETVNPNVFIFAEQAQWETTGAQLLSAFDAAFTKPFEFAARNALMGASAAPLYDTMAATLAALPEDKTFLCIIGDHDVDRLASNIGSSFERGKAAAAVLLLQPLPPIIYHGDEIGMLGTKQSYGSDANDIPMREPFKWNAVAGPPMSNYWVLNSQAYNNAFSSNNDGRSVEEQLYVSGSLLEQYRTLIAIRKQNVALRRGSYTPITASESSVWSFLRHVADTQTLLVAINLSSTTRTTTLDLSEVDMPDGYSEIHDIVSHEDLPNLTTTNKNAYSLQIPAYSYRILELDVTPGGTPPAIIDGLNIPTDMGPRAPRATQNNYTAMGDNLNELNQLFVLPTADSLRIGITGNIDTLGTGLALFFDTTPGGQNTLDTDYFSAPPVQIPNLDATTFDTGFEPDYLIYANAYGGTIYVDHYTLPAGQEGTKHFVGQGTVADLDGYLTGGSNPNGMQIAINNANTTGVTDLTATNATQATAGIEIVLPLADIGMTTPASGTLQMMVTLVSTTEIGNQTLPGLGPVQPAIPYGHDYNETPGHQYITISLDNLPGDWNNDGQINLEDFTQFPPCLTGPLASQTGTGVPPTEACQIFDLDSDQDTDLQDFALFQTN